MAGESAHASARRQREKAARLIRAAELNEQGAHGEEQTAALLACLPGEQWTVMHDVRWPGRTYANIDHIAIGPPGVFVIDSKNWTGSITVGANVLRQNGYRREKAVDSATEAARALAELLPHLRIDLVHPVLCFVRPQPLTSWARGVRVCSTATLLTLLRSQPNVLDPASVAAVVAALTSGLEGVPSSRSALPAAAHAPRAARGRTRTTPAPRPRVKRRSRSLVRPLVGLGLCGVLVLQPDLVTGVGQAVAELIAESSNS